MISEKFAGFERPGILESGFEVTFNLQSGAFIQEVKICGIRKLSSVVQYQTYEGIDIWIPKYLVFKHRKDAETAIRIVLNDITLYLAGVEENEPDINENF